jgi:hypothetical protein
MSDIESYLESMRSVQRHCYESNSAKGLGKGRDDWKYLCIEDFVLREGQMFTTPDAELPDDVPRGIVKECFKNCMNAVAFGLYQDNSDYFYCEGYAVGLIPMLHAWLVTPEGKVVDPTWSEPGTEYFGVAFNRKFAQRQTLKQECYGLLDAWTSEWPLLQGIDPEEWKVELDLVGENVCTRVR